MHRRFFIGSVFKPVGLLAAACVSVPPTSQESGAKVDRPAIAKPDSATDAAARRKTQLTLNPLAVAQASFFRMFQNGSMTLEKFPQFVSNSCGLSRVQWSARLLAGITPASAKALRAECAANGVRSLLLDPAIGIGLTSTDASVSAAAVEKLKPWCAIATELACSGLAIDLRGQGTYDEQLPRAVAGANLAAKVASEAGLPLVVQSLGGMTSNGTFMAALMQQLQNPAIRLEPTFDSWQVDGTDSYNRIRGLALLIPYAASILADYIAFLPSGECAAFKTNYLMRQIRDSTFRGPVTILFKGSGDELDGVLKAKTVLIKYKCIA